MNAKEDSWYVKYRGHTLGPIHTQQVKISIQKRELGFTDKIAAAANPVWQEIGQCEIFQSLFASPNSKLIPSPSSVVFKKRKVEIPKNIETPESPRTKNPRNAAPAATASEQFKLTNLVKVETPANGVNKKGPLPRQPVPKKFVKKKSRDKKATKQKFAIPTPVKVLETVSDSAVTISPASLVARTENVPVAKETPVPSASAPQIQEDILASFPEKPHLSPTGASAGELLSDTKSLIGLWQEWKDFEEPLDPPKPLKKSKAEETKKEFTEKLTTKDFLSVLPNPPVETSNAIQIQLTLSKTWLAIFSLLFFGLVAGGLFYFQAQKTRDLKDSHLSDPSSPTIQPSTPDDPIPSLKAPTRPKRE